MLSRRYQAEEAISDALSTTRCSCFGNTECQQHLHSNALCAPTGSPVLISSRPVTLHPPPLTGISLDEPAREHICRDPYFHGAFLFLVGAVGWLVAAFLGVAYPSGIPVTGYDLGNWYI